MLARRTLRVASVAVLLVLSLIVGVVLAVVANAGTRVPGTPNRATAPHVVVNFDALAGGRTAVLSTESGFNSWAVSNVRAVTTAYSPSGLKLWVVDVRDYNMRSPEPDTRNRGLTTYNYNRDSRQMRRGWILQQCVTWVTRVGPDPKACATNRV